MNLPSKHPPAAMAFPLRVDGLISDDVSGEVDWDQRDWHNQFEVQERLFWLAVKACLLQ